MSKKVNKHRDPFLQMARTGNIPAEFMKMIKAANIYRQEPAADLRKFTKAFKSPKTLKSVRYAMIVSALTGDHSLVDRAMRIDVKDAKFAIEPVYKARIGLSHFKITGIGKNKSVFDPKMNPKVRRLLMGTPIASTRGKMVTRVMRVASDPKVTKKLQTWGKAVLEKGEPEAMTAMVSEALQTYINSQHQQLLSKWESEARIQMEQYGTVDYDLELAIESLQDTNLKLKNISKLSVIKAVERKVELQIGATRIPFEKLISMGFPPEYLVLITSTSMEIIKHLEGLIWVLDTFIKLNDHRNRVYDSDPPLHADPAYDEETNTVDLHGFPQHLQHYREEAINKYWTFFLALGIMPQASEIGEDLTHLQYCALEAESKIYFDAEHAQDEIDELIDQSAALLYKLSALIVKIMNVDELVKQNPINVLMGLIHHKFATKDVGYEHIPHKSRRIEHIQKYYQTNQPIKPGGQDELIEKLKRLKTNLYSWKLDERDREKEQAEEERRYRLRNRQWLINRKPIDKKDE